MIRIFRLNFNYSLYDLNGEWIKLSDLDKDILMNLSAESFFDYEEYNSYICYIIAENKDMLEYIRTLKKYDIKLEYKDISNSILNNSIDIEHELFERVNEENSIKYDFFIEDLNIWLLENLSIDIILDRISEVGMSGLNKTEKEFLKNFNK